MAPSMNNCYTPLLLVSHTVDYHVEAAAAAAAAVVVFVVVVGAVFSH